MSFPVAVADDSLAFLFRLCCGENRELSSYLFCHVNHFENIFVEKQYINIFNYGSQSYFLYWNLVQIEVFVKFPPRDLGGFLLGKWCENGGVFFSCWCQHASTVASQKYLEMLFFQYAWQLTHNQSSILNRHFSLPTSKQKA